MGSVLAHWEHYPHQADIGVRGFGPTAAAAFAEAALAMTAAITDPDRVRPETPVEIACRADDLEDLLYDWLNALVFEMATRRMLFSRFEVEIADGGLTATAWGEELEADRHRPAVEIKGATYTGLRVRDGGGAGWTAECIIDV